MISINQHDDDETIEYMMFGKKLSNANLEMSVTFS
jgi:hypothetical protein